MHIFDISSRLSIEISNEISELIDTHQQLSESVIWCKNITWVKSYYLECGKLHEVLAVGNENFIYVNI